MAMALVARPPLPPAASWFPGHMSKFSKMLPGLLSRTDVVLELRDARLPLTSINGTLEGHIQRWKQERGRIAGPAAPAGTLPGVPAIGTVCERIVVFNKRDLVPEWGLEPFRRAMQSRFPDQRVFFASWHRQRDIKTLMDMLIGIAKENPAAPELNVLVVGMPNVGKSTLLNALRQAGIDGPVSKALATSALPGMTRALSTRLKLCADPLIYSFDSPGVMLPFLGRGDIGAERAVKLALIAGLKEGLYDDEALAAYLLYRFNLLDPVSPAYLTLLPRGARPTGDIGVFLDALAKRLGMLGRGGAPDTSRAAAWLVRWWRADGARLSARAPAPAARVRDGGPAAGKQAPAAAGAVPDADVPAAPASAQELGVSPADIAPAARQEPQAPVSAEPGVTGAAPEPAQGLGAAAADTGRAEVTAPATGSPVPDAGDLAAPEPAQNLGAEAADTAQAEIASEFSAYADASAPPPAASDPTGAPSDGTSDALVDLALPALERRGWGFDIEWTLSPPSSTLPTPTLEERMGAAIDASHAAAIDAAADGTTTSQRQEKLRVKEEARERQLARVKVILAARGITPGSAGKGKGKGKGKKGGKGAGSKGGKVKWKRK